MKANRPIVTTPPKNKAKAKPKPSAKQPPPVDVEERKHKQYLDALFKRNTAQDAIKTLKAAIATAKAEIAVSQNRINVLEYLLRICLNGCVLPSGKGDSEVAKYLMDVVEIENAAIKCQNREIADCGEYLKKHHAIVFENGPDMQNSLLDDEEVSQ